MSLLVLIALFVVSGCGETMDLYGESRRSTSIPGEDDSKPKVAETTVRGNRVRAVSFDESAKTDYAAAEGVFLIVPPENINPKNLEKAPDPQLITIDFQEGFEWLQTVVIVDNAVVFNERLRTRNGFADTVSIRYEEPPARFTLQFPALDVSETFTVDPDKGRFLGISFVNRQLSLNLQEKPFFYSEENRAGANARF